MLQPRFLRGFLQFVVGCNNPPASTRFKQVEIMVFEIAAAMVLAVAVAVAVAVSLAVFKAAAVGS